MAEVVIRFLTFEVVTVHPMIYLGLAAVWLVLLITALMSVLSLRVGLLAKSLWMLLILTVPVIGLACYALRCLFRGDWSMLKPLMPQNKAPRRI